MVPNPPVNWPAGLWLTAAAGALVLGLPICVRLKTFVNSARIEKDMLSLILKVRPKFRFSCGRRAERKSPYMVPVAGPKVPLAGLAQAAGFRTTSVYGLMQPQFKFLMKSGCPGTR